MNFVLVVWRGGFGMCGYCEVEGCESSVGRWGLEANGPRQRGNTGGLGGSYSGMCEAVIDDLLLSLKRCCGFIGGKIRELFLARHRIYLLQERKVYRYLGGFVVKYEDANV